MSKRPGTEIGDGAPSPSDVAGHGPDPEERARTVRGRAVVKGYKAPSRKGMRAMTVYVPPEAWEQLSFQSIRERSSIQALLEEAVNDMFAKRRLPQVNMRK